jgi:hypothetical protein
MVRLDNLPALSRAATLPEGIWWSSWSGGRLDWSGATLARCLRTHAARSGCANNKARLRNKTMNAADAIA